MHLRGAVEAQVQVLHINRRRPRRQPPHRAQPALADRPAQPKRQQRARTQRQPQFQPVRGQHLRALGQQLAGHQRQWLALVHDVLPRQPCRRRAGAVLQLHPGAGGQQRHRHLQRVDFDQRLAGAAQHPQQVALVAQHVGVELRALAQRLDALAVANQRAHALDAPDQRGVVAPSHFARQRLVQIKPQRAQQQHADQGKHQREAQRQTARPPPR